MPSEYPSQESNRRINIYLVEDDLSLLNKLGNALHKKGVPGMLDDKGKPNKSAIVRRLLKDKADDLGL